MLTNRRRTALAGTALLATWTTAVSAVTVGALADPVGAATAKRPDLVARSVAVDRTTVAEGGTLGVRHTAVNRGTARAGASTTRFYLTHDPAGSVAARAASTSNPRSAPADVVLTGSRSVPVLRPRASARPAQVVVGVPLGTAAGRYRLLACTDDRGVVREKSETDNCAAASPTITVTAVTSTDPAEQLQLEQYADTTPWMPTEQLSVMYLESLCARTVPAQRMSPATAISRLRAMLTSAGGAGVLDRIAASGLADDAVEAQQLAAQGALQGSPGTALAALLRAHDLEPRIGTHLVNAAAVAVSLGRPNEALGLLDGAAGLDFRRGALGIAPQSDALVVRGEALLLTGRTSQARAAFQAARQAAPLLSEADAGLAAVEACSGNDTLAARYARRSRQRSQEPKPAAEDPTTPLPPRPAPALDLGHGEETQMRKVPVPDSPAQGADLAPTYQAIDRGFQAEIQQDLDAQDRLQQRLDGAAELLSPAEVDRRDALMGLAGTAADDPTVQMFADAVDSKIRAMAKVRDAFFGGPGTEQSAKVVLLSHEAAQACQGVPDSETCYEHQMNSTCRPALSNAHAQWRSILGEGQLVANEYVAELSRRTSAYASNLADDAAHDMVMLGVTEAERTAYSRLIEAALTMAGQESAWRGLCVTPMDPAPTPAAQGVPAPRSAGTCPEELRATTFTLNLGVSKLTVQCDKITQSFSEKVFPFVSAFADLTWDLRTGQLSVYAGAKAQFRDLSFRSGVYLTTDGRGGIKDVGLRAGGSGKRTSGIPEYGAGNGDIDFSFLAAFRTTP